ncbi:MAG: type pilus assembly protein PilA [Thermoanaerobacteraceae bacterium]|nr:type pilus assembly protein PilA [Thermoanaerobacteraceae bacterium]
MIKIATAFKKIGKDKRGFTLVELMAVLAVLAIIAAIAVPRFTGTIAATKEKADKATAQIIARAAEQKYLDKNETGTVSYLVLADATKFSGSDFDGYLKEAPKVQKDGVAQGYVAVVEDGKCTGVYYSESKASNNEYSGNNLLD